MSGMLISVVPPTLYDFVSLATGQSVAFNVASRIDTTGVEAAVLQVRVHTVNLNTGDSITVDAVPHGYSPDDPGTDFGQVGTTMATASFAGQLTVGGLYTTTALSGQFGALLRIAVKATRGA